jgi:hypothetical protein
MDADLQKLIDDAKALVASPDSGPMGVLMARIDASWGIVTRLAAYAAPKLPEVGRWCKCKHREAAHDNGVCVWDSWSVEAGDYVDRCDCRDFEPAGE